jgi:hypothetical protein
MVVLQVSRCNQEEINPILQCAEGDIALAAQQRPDALAAGLRLARAASVVVIDHKPLNESGRWDAADSASPALGIELPSVPAFRKVELAFDVPGVSALFAPVVVSVGLGLHFDETAEVKPCCAPCAILAPAVVPPRMDVAGQAHLQHGQWQPS